MQQSRYGGALLAAAFAVICLSACGSSDDAAPASTSADSGEVAAAQRKVDEYSKAPTSVGVTEPLAKNVQGKRIVYVQCAAPVCVLVGDQLKEAATRLGATVQFINAGATPQSVRQAFNAAVATKPDAVVESAIPTVAFQPALAGLEEAGIPVVTGAVLADPKVAASFNDGDAEARIGGLLADWVVADSKGKGKAVYLLAPEFAGIVPAAKEFEATVQRTCSSCSAEVLEVKATDVGKAIPSSVVSYLQRHPDTTHVVAGYGDLLTGVPAALKRAGLEDVRLLSTAGGPVNYAYIKAGQQAADLSLFLDVYGWQMMDATARAIGGQELTVPPLPLQFVNRESLTFDPKGQPPFGTDFQAAFAKLWEGASP